MKKTIYFILALLFAFNAKAQSVDEEKLQRFLDEFKALSSEYATCETESLTPNSRLKLPEGFVVFKFSDQNSPFTSITAPDIRFVYSVSENNKGYLLMLGILDKYYDRESEDIFGIPLMACQREEGEEQTLFMDENNTLAIMDNGHDEMEILYTNFNLINSIKGTLQSALEVFGEEYVDVEVFGGMDFSVKVTNAAELGKNNPVVLSAPSANNDEIMAWARNIYDKAISAHEEELATAKSDEQRDEISAALAGLKKHREEHFADLETELNELDRPSFVEVVHGSDEYFVAIPEIPSQLKEKQKPYAASGVYDWINTFYSFRAGAKTQYTDIVSGIITPHDVAREFVIRNYPRDRWRDEGFTPEYKKLAAIEYQGSTPAVLYSFSQTENGYNDMLMEFEDFFRRKLGEKVLGLEVIQNSENNGKRFVQMWGEGGIIMSLYDSPADKYCHMSIIVGGVSGFEHAVNEYCFGGEKDLAKRYNIVIDSDLRNSSCGIHFVNEEYFYAGKPRKNGVHIDFGYARKFTE